MLSDYIRVCGTMFTVDELRVVLTKDGLTVGPNDGTLPAYMLARNSENGRALFPHEYIVWQYTCADRGQDSAPAFGDGWTFIDDSRCPNYWIRPATAREIELVESRESGDLEHIVKPFPWHRVPQMKKAGVQF